MFLSILIYKPLLIFERRDILLIAGLLLVMIGMIPFMAPVYAAIIVILIYFGVKFYMGMKRRQISSEVGMEGICIECGSRIQDKMCPICDAGEDTSTK